MPTLPAPMPTLPAPMPTLPAPMPAAFVSPITPMRNPVSYPPQVPGLVIPAPVASPTNLTSDAAQAEARRVYNSAVEYGSESERMIKDATKALKEGNVAYAKHLGSVILSRQASLHDSLKRITELSPKVTIWPASQEVASWVQSIQMFVIAVDRPAQDLARKLETAAAQYVQDDLKRAKEEQERIDDFSRIADNAFIGIESVIHSGRFVEAREYLSVAMEANDSAQKSAAIVAKLADKIGDETFASAEARQVRPEDMIFLNDEEQDVTRRSRILALQAKQAADAIQLRVDAATAAMSSITPDVILEEMEITKAVKVQNDKMIALRASSYAYMPGLPPMPNDPMALVRTLDCITCSKPLVSFQDGSVVAATLSKLSCGHIHHKACVLDRAMTTQQCACRVRLNVVNTEYGPEIEGAATVYLPTGCSIESVVRTLKGL